MAFAHQPQKPILVRRLMVGPDGVTRTVFVDPRTGNQVQNTSGYTIIDVPDKADTNGRVSGRSQGRDERDNSETTPDPMHPDVGRTPETARESLAQRMVSGNFTGERPAIAAAAQTGKPQTEATRSQFGDTYVNKPAWAGFAGFLPGLLGTVGTAANLGINANNTAAVNDQRANLGFAPKTTLNNLGSTLVDKHGYIGDVATQDGQGDTHVTPVSFEAQDNIGRTTFTPDEARMRNELTPTTREATAAETSNAVSAYKDQYGSTGFLSSISQAAKSLFSGVLGTPSSSTQSSGGVSSTAVNPSASTNGGYKSGYPSAPTPPTQTQGAVNNQQYDRDHQGPSNPGGVGLY